MGELVYTRKPFDVTDFNGGCLFSQDYSERVCKTWCNVIDEFVLKRKCEKDNYDVKNKDLPWFACYWILVKKNLWNRNLIKNGCGEFDLEHWIVISHKKSWTVERPPSRCEMFPLDMDYRIRRYNSCFSTVRGFNIKEQTIDLAAEGATPELMDILQPQIIISEWYYSDVKEKTRIRLQVELCDKHRNPVVSKSFDHKIIRRTGSFYGTDWRQAIYIFKNYGPGVRYIYYQNSCNADPPKRGYLSIKITGASVVLKIQKEIKKKNERKMEITNPRKLFDLNKGFDCIFWDFGCYFNNISQKILAKILSYVEPDDLVFNCRRVCKLWCNVIDDKVWKLKLTREENYEDEKMKKLSWLDCYLILTRKKIFNRNLIKNGCGQEYLKHWTLLEKGDKCAWRTTKPIFHPETFPEHIDDEVKLHNYYFEIRVFGHCDKEQVVDLIAEGATPFLMDFVQPNILVSDWCIVTDCTYRLEIALCDKSMKILNLEILSMDSKTLECGFCVKIDKHSDWQKVSHVFQNYKPGVRYVLFRHSAESLVKKKKKCESGWIKMTGASVVLKIPDTSIKFASSEEFLFWEGY